MQVPRVRRTTSKDMAVDKEPRRPSGTLKVGKVTAEKRPRDKSESD